MYNIQTTMGASNQHGNHTDSGKHLDNSMSTVWLGRHCIPSCHIIRSQGLVLIAIPGDIPIELATKDCLK